MDRLKELASKLTPAQLREVEDFAEFLASRHGLSAGQAPVREQKVSFEGWAGRLAHVDKTAIELTHEANELRAAWGTKGE